MTDTPELNVWREASDAASENAVKWKQPAERRAAAVIRSYGDQRYQAAIDDVVAWLGDNPRGMLEYEEWYANEITRRFGKGQDHG